MYDPSDLIKIEMPRHTAHLLNSFASQMAVGPSKGAGRVSDDDKKAYTDFVIAYAEAIKK